MKTEPLARTALLLSALAGLFAVAAGALAAHGLEGRAAVWMEKASRYAMWHGLALAVAVALELASLPLVLAFAAGILLFSGSLAAMALGAPGALARITPLGGVAFLVGWVILALEVLRARRR